MEKSEWTRQWEEVHRQESEKQIGKLAMDKAYRRYEWWNKFNQVQRDEWQEEQDRQV